MGEHMKTRLILPIAAATIALAAAIPAQPSFADSATPVTTQKKIVVHKKKRHVVRHHRQYEELEPYRSSGFIGKFPGSCAYDRAAGNCMIDLGYGRCVPCDLPGGRY
jgi:hypothetical protein